MNPTGSDICRENFMDHHHCTNDDQHAMFKFDFKAVDEAKYFAENERLWQQILALRDDQSSESVNGVKQTPEHCFEEQEKHSFEFLDRKPHAHFNESDMTISKAPSITEDKSFLGKKITDNDNFKERIIVIPRKCNKTIDTSTIPRMDWNNYHRLDVIHRFLDDLECDYPSICTVGVIGKSREGRALKIIKVSNSNSSNAAVWLDAGIHAREWIAPAVATYIINHIATNFNYLPESMTNKDWFILPVMNPDGYEYSHTTDRMWRKNRAWSHGQCVGVDLNRNFSYGWGQKGSSDNPTHAFFRGPEPFSEPESSAVRDMLINTGISFRVYVTLHSFGQIIMFPFAFREKICPDYMRLLEGATIMSKAIYQTSGNTYKVGISRDVMYGAAGTSNDFSYGAARIPFCYLLELRSRQHKFKVPQEEIEETGSEILSAVKALMEFVDTWPPDIRANPEDDLYGR